MNTKLYDSLQGLATQLSPKLDATNYRLGSALSYEQLSAIWSSSWIAQKICKKKASDMTRRWREVKSNELTAEQLEQFDKLERKYKLRQVFEQISMWTSLYGGVGVLIITDKAVDMPLLSGQRLQRLVVIPPHLIQGVGEAETSVLSENYGRYTSYRINNAIDVHYSRLLLVSAVSKGIDSVQRKELFGYSDLQAVYETLKRFDFASANIAELVAESKVDVFKMPDLNNSLLNGNEADIAQTMQQVQLIKSVSNSLLIDSSYEYEQKQLAFAGLTDLLREFRNAVAGSADMPVTILFGQSVSGLASGDEDIKNYHESIHGLQEVRLRPIFEVLDPLLLAEITDKPVTDFWFEFCSLDETSDEQRMAMFSQFVQGVAPLLQYGVLNEAQVAQELRDTGLVSCLSTADIDNLMTQAQAESSDDDSDSELT